MARLPNPYNNINITVAGFGYHTWKQAEQRHKVTKFHQNIQKNLKDKGLPGLPKLPGRD